MWFNWGERAIVAMLCLIAIGAGLIVFGVGVLIVRMAWTLPLR